MAALTLYCMATFKVKTFNELSGKGQNGDIAIIERADINGNQGFTFRDASGWSLPFVQVQTLGANLMTTNTSQSVSAAKTFQGEVVINDDFSVIGATDIDLGFTGTMTIDAEDEPGSLLHIKDIDSILITSKNEVALNANDTLGNFTKVELSTTDLNLESNSALQIQAQDSIVINSLGDLDVFVSNDIFIESNDAVTSSFVRIEPDKIVAARVFGATSHALTIDAGDITLDAGDSGSNYSRIYLSTTELKLAINNAARLKVTGLQSYADNAAALLGGLTTDMVYKTATGELRIVV